MVTALIALSHGGPVAIGLATLYLYIPLDSFFFSRRAASLYVAYGTVAAVIAWRPLGALPPAFAIGLIIVNIVAAVEVGWLVDAAARAERDPLTGLLNRRGLDRLASQAFTLAARSGRTFTVAYLDIDHFKAVNDGAGRPAGDLLLREAAAAWTALLPYGCVLARQGGDEFAVLLCGPRRRSRRHRDRGDAARRPRRADGIRRLCRMGAA
jgi:GGDEF domain-containing protein